MPAAIPIVAAIAGAAASYGVGGGILGAIIGLAVSTAITVGGALLLGGQEERKSSSQSSDFNLSSAGGGRTQMVRQPITSWKLAYGRVRASGPLLFLQSSGSSYQHLYMMLPLAAHRIDAVEQLYFYETPIEYDGSGNVTTAPFNGYAQVEVHLGDDDQTASTLLTSELPDYWTSNHRLRGHAYVVAKITWKVSVWPGGIPKLAAIFRGKRVLDPRTGATAWTRNAALIVRDYLTYTSRRGGVGVAINRLESASWIAAANVCEEQVALKGGGTIDRYPASGMVDTEEKPSGVLEAMLTSCAGRLTYSGGLWALYPGAYRAATTTFTEDDARDRIVVRPKRLGRDRFNAVKGTFISPAHDYQPTSFPEISADEYTQCVTFEAEDNGERKYSDLEFKWTDDHRVAQRLAMQYLLQHRNQAEVDFPANLKGLTTKIWNCMALALSRYSWSAKVFRIADWGLVEDGGVDMTLGEETASAYAWNAATDEQDMTEATGEISVVDPTVDRTPPTLVTGLAASAPASSQLRLDWTNGTDEESGWWAGRAYYHTADDIDLASNSVTVYGVAEQPSSVILSGLPAGTWYAWVKSLDYAGNITSNAAGSVNATVT